MGSGKPREQIVSRKRGWLSVVTADDTLIKRRHEKYLLDVATYKSLVIEQHFQKNGW